MDGASRAVLSRRLSNTLDAAFCAAALDDALAALAALARPGRPEIFNTAQGSQFTGRDFTGRLDQAGIRISTDGRGRWMDVGNPRGSVDAALARIGHRRRVATVAPTFLHALDSLCGTDLLGTFPAAVMASCAGALLTPRAVPVPIEPVTLHLVRHRRTDLDPAVMLVAELVRAAVPRLCRREVCLQEQARPGLRARLGGPAR